MSTNADNSSDLKKPKFMFGRSFDMDAASLAAEALRNAPTPMTTMTVAEFEAARAESFAAGVHAGKAEEKEEQMATLLQLMDKVSASIQHLTHITKVQQEQTAEAVAQSVKAITQKALPRYLEQQGFAEIEKLVIDTLHQLKDEPRLVIRVADQHLDACIKHLNDVATKAAFEGKLVVLADGNLGPSDCRIEWADGGLERLENNLWASIDQALSHRIGTHRAQVDNYTQAQPTMTEQAETGASNEQPTE